MVIYKIDNNINGKIYIGQTRKPLSKRIAGHIHDGHRKQSIIGMAINKYGGQAFSVSAIDESPSQEIIDEKEKYWIKTFNSRAPNGYNIKDGGSGGGRPAGWHHSSEVRERMALMRRGKRKSESMKEKLSIANKGRHHSIEVLQKMSESQKKRQERNRMNK